MYASFKCSWPSDELKESASEELRYPGPQRSMSASDITTLQTGTLELYCSGRKHENIQ